LAALVTRFSQGRNIGIVQQAIAEFHSLSLAPNEKLEAFIDRLTAAMRRLYGPGQTDVDLNVYSLGRLKESLIYNARYAQVALTLRANTEITWDAAVDLLLSYEMTLALGTPVRPAPQSTQRVPESIARLSSSEGEERGITMDSGVSLHFLTEETTATIDI
jgi:hypothetical protein